MIIAELERTTAPDPNSLAQAYSYASRTTWLSEALRAYCDQLAVWCEPLPGWSLRRDGHDIWETTSPYLAFAHALVVRCAIQDIPKIADQPFVIGIKDGESEITILRSDSALTPSGSSVEEDLSTWTENPVGSEELASQFSACGWLPISQTLIDSLREDPFSVTALSNALPSLPEQSDQFAGLGVDMLPTPIEGAEETALAWPYGLSVTSLGAVDALSRADLLLSVDAALHAGAALVALCAIDGIEPNDFGVSKRTAALLWEPISLSGVAATGAVEGAGSLGELPSSAFPVTEAVATMGSHADRVVLAWEDLEGVGSYEVLRRAQGDQVYSSIAIVEGTTFSDSDVETCVPNRYAIRVISEDGLGIEAYTGKGYIGNVPETCEWIVVTDGISSDGGLEIEWAPAKNATYYNLWRSEPVKTPYQSSTKVYLVYKGPETSFLDLDLVPGVQYAYVVVPYNGCGGSAVGNPAARGTAMYVTPPEGNPKPPDWLTASLVTPADQIDLHWRAVGDATEYRITRAESYQGTYEEVCVTSDVRWSDTSAEHCQDYWYRIQSISGDESGAFSAVTHGVCGGKPGRPSGVIASDSTYTDAIRLHWGPGHEADYYHIFRASSMDGPYSRIAVTYDLFFIDLGLEPGQTFWYRVASRNLCGGSGYSDPTWGATTY